MKFTLATATALIYSVNAQTPGALPVQTMAQQPPMAQQPLMQQSMMQGQVLQQQPMMQQPMMQSQFLQQQPLLQGQQLLGNQFLGQQYPIVQPNAFPLQGQILPQQQFLGQGQILPQQQLLGQTYNPLMTNPLLAQQYNPYQMNPYAYLPKNCHVQEKLKVVVQTGAVPAKTIETEEMLDCACDQLGNPIHDTCTPPNHLGAQDMNPYLAQQNLHGDEMLLAGCYGSGAGQLHPCTVDSYRYLDGFHAPDGHMWEAEEEESIFTHKHLVCTQCDVLGNPRLNSCTDPNAPVVAQPVAVPVRETPPAVVTLREDDSN